MSSRRSKSPPRNYNEPLAHRWSRFTFPCLDNASLLINDFTPFFLPPPKSPCFRRVCLNEPWTPRHLPLCQGLRCPQAARQPRSIPILRARPLRDADSRPLPPRARWTLGTMTMRLMLMMDLLQGDGSVLKGRSSPTFRWSRTQSGRVSRRVSKRSLKS